MPHVEGGGVVALEIGERFGRRGAEGVNIQTGGADEALLHGGQDEFLHFIIESVCIENGDGRIVAAELLERQYLEKLFERPEAAGGHDECIRARNHGSLALGHGVCQDKLRAAVKENTVYI